MANAGDIIGLGKTLKRVRKRIDGQLQAGLKLVQLQDQSKARVLGVTSQTIAQASRTVLSGTRVGQFREGDMLIDIVLRPPLDERGSMTEVVYTYLPTSFGGSVPIAQPIKPTLSWELYAAW